MQQLLQDFLTPAAAGRILELSPARVRQLDTENKLKAQRVGSGMRLFHRADVEEYRRQREERKVRK